jgi:hypothetical protein
MTKTELLEEILNELKVIHALLDMAHDEPPQTPAEQYEAMAATLKPSLDAVAIMHQIADAIDGSERY